MEHLRADHGAALDDLIDAARVSSRSRSTCSAGVSPDEDRQRVFGGQVAAQALVAAGRTVEHGGRCTRCTRTSCGPATRSVPIVYDVDRIRDGRSFTTRRVVAIQHGRGDLQPAGVVPDRRGRVPTTSTPMPEVPRPRRPADVPASGIEPLPRAVRRATSSTGSGASARSTRARSTTAALARSRAAREPRADVWIQRQRHAARRPAAARVRRRVRVRPHAARHRDDAARDLVRRRAVP